MERMWAATLVCLSIVVALWSGWLSFAGKPAIEENSRLGEINRARITVLETEVMIHQEQVKRLIAGNERLAQEIVDMKSRLPIKWRVK